MTHSTKETKEKLIFSSVNEQITKETKEISSVSLVIVLEGGGVKIFLLGLLGLLRENVID